MEQHSLLSDRLPDEIRAAAERLAQANERVLSMNSDRLKMRLLLAVVQEPADPQGAMQRVLSERREELERWQRELRKRREERR